MNYTRWEGKLVNISCKAVRNKAVKKLRAIARSFQVAIDGNGNFTVGVA